LILHEFDIGCFRQSVDRANSRKQSEGAVVELAHAGNVQTQDSGYVRLTRSPNYGQVY